MSAFFLNLCHIYALWRGAWYGAARRAAWSAWALSSRDEGLSQQPVQVRGNLVLPGSWKPGAVGRGPRSLWEQVTSEAASWWGVGGQSVGRGASVAGALGELGVVMGRKG